MVIYARLQLFCILTFCSLEVSSKAPRSLTDIPESLTALLECPTPPPYPKCKAHSEFNLGKRSLPIFVNQDDLAWLMMRINALNDIETSAPEATDNHVSERPQVPGWSGYNSLVSKVRI